MSLMLTDEKMATQVVFTAILAVIMNAIENRVGGNWVSNIILLVSLTLQHPVKVPTITPSR